MESAVVARAMKFKRRAVSRAIIIIEDLLRYNLFDRDLWQGKFISRIETKTMQKCGTITQSIRISQQVA